MDEREFPIDPLREMAPTELLDAYLSAIAENNADRASAAARVAHALMGYEEWTQLIIAHLLTRIATLEARIAPCVP